MTQVRTVTIDGKKKMQAVLDAAIPLAEFLWRQELARGPVDTPEARAGLEQRLIELCDRIRDDTVRRNYKQWFRERIAKAFRSKP